MELQAEKAKDRNGVDLYMGDWFVIPADTDKPTGALVAGEFYCVSYILNDRILFVDLDNYKVMVLSDIIEKIELENPTEFRKIIAL